MKNLLLTLLIISFFSCSEEVDYKIPKYLEFEKIATFHDSNITFATGMAGSQSLNKIYIAYRSFNNASNNPSEKIIEYNLSNNSIREYYFDISDFITKKVHLIEDKLLILGGKHLNIYSLDFESTPSSIVHGLSISRFGSAVFNNELYTWGGDLNGIDSDKIRKWNMAESTFEVIGKLPKPKTWAHGEIIRNKLYVFGGQAEFANTAAEDLIYAYDLEKEITETFYLNEPLYRTFTGKRGHLIFVGGQTKDYDIYTFDLDIYLGVFDTRTNELTKIESNLSSNGFTTIHQLTVIGNEIFVLYGDYYDIASGIKLMKATLH